VCKHCEQGIPRENFPALLDGNSAQCYLGVKAQTLNGFHQTPGFPGFFVKKFYSRRQLDKWAEGELYPPVIKADSNTVSMQQIEDETKMWLKELNTAPNLNTSSKAGKHRPALPSETPALSVKESPGIISRNGMRPRSK